MILSPFVSIGVLLISPGYFQVTGKSVTVAPLLWKQGDMWEIHAECFSAKKDADKPRKLTMAASVAQEATVAGKQCWVLALFPDGQLPDGRDMTIHAYVDKRSGWPLKIIELDGPFEAKLIPFGERNVIGEALEFFPAELFTVSEPAEWVAGTKKVVLTKEALPGETRMGMTFYDNKVEQWRISQTWKDGELFWNSYEKHIKGRLTFRATAKVDQLAKRTDAEKTAAQKAADASQAAIEAKAKQYRDAHPLRQDKRLYALVQVEPKRPSVAHVLRRLKEATGLDMDIDPELEKHVPDLGYISPGKEGYFAWQLMEHLTKIEIENPRWEKTATGYRFAGISKVPLGRVLVTSDDQPPPPLPTSPPTRWLLFSSIALGFAFIAVGGIVIYRRRGKTVPKTP